MSAAVFEAMHRFPRGAIVLDSMALAAAFRHAATELDELAQAAPAYEIGTLRRKVRAVVLNAIAAAEGAT